MQKFRKILLGLSVLAIGLSTVFFSLSSKNSSVRAESPNQTNVSVERAPNSSVAHGLVERATASWPWYIARISGLVAAITLIILMLSGIGLITGHFFSFFEPLTAWASHRALGIVFGISVFLHIFALYMDHFVPFGLKDLLIPFLSSYKPVVLFGVTLGSLYVAFGVLSMYLTFLIVLTSLVWVEKYPYLWKIIHLLSYIVMMLVFVHALRLGTDLSSGVLRIIWIGVAFLITFASLARLWRAKTI